MPTRATLGRDRELTRSIAFFVGALCALCVLLAELDDDDEQGDGGDDDRG